MRKVFSWYSQKFVTAVVYMLQSTEYQPRLYLQWLWRVQNIGLVMRRRTLERTKSARVSILVLYIGITLQVALGLLLIWHGTYISSLSVWLLGLAIFLTYPIIWAHLIVIPLILGRVIVINPHERKLIQRSKEIFSAHHGIKIAVAGSYGKTSMKELLGTVLAEGKNVAITPANKNVASSHARFAFDLKGDEQVLVIEFGEGRPGDVARFSQTIDPDIGIITGIAPAHLDQYKTLNAASEDIFSLANYLHDENVYVNGESDLAKYLIKDSHKTYSSVGVDGWKVKNVKIDFNGVDFVMTKAKKAYRLKSGLLGRHQIGPIAAVVAIADSLGLDKEQIETGVAKTTSFEHRMQARELRGAWLIDDTYNGNIDGIKAGLSLLRELPAKRKIYITPGLVDQGMETKKIHLQMGELIADTNPDITVLMQNSVTQYIKQGLEKNKYKGDIQIVDDPLEYYQNLEHFIASGDIVLMQNDWTDNYF